MQAAIKLFFSPMAFAIGFLWPLAAQVLIAANVASASLGTWLLALLLVLPFGLMAQLRGSWLWIR